LAQDASELFEVRGDPDAMAFRDWLPNATPEMTPVVVDQLLKNAVSGNALFWTIRFRREASFVGLCDLSEIQPCQSADIWFLIVRRLWDQGLAHEAVACLLQYAHESGLKSAHARIHSGNERSERLLKRTGFRLIEEIPDYEIRPGIHRNCKRFEIAL
jgi:ribosomal-protein-alanine N-acetyltransferase